MRRCGSGEGRSWLILLFSVAEAGWKPRGICRRKSGRKVSEKTGKRLLISGVSALFHLSRTLLPGSRVVPHRQVYQNPRLQGNRFRRRDRRERPGKTKKILPYDAKSSLLLPGGFVKMNRAEEGLHDPQTHRKIFLHSEAVSAAACPPFAGETASKRGESVLSASRKARKI